VHRLDVDVDPTTMRLIWLLRRQRMMREKGHLLVVVAQMQMRLLQMDNPHYNQR